MSEKKRSKWVPINLIVSRGFFLLPGLQTQTVHPCALRVQRPLNWHGQDVAPNTEP